MRSITMMSTNTAQLGASSQGTAGPANFTDLTCTRLGTGATLLAFLHADGESQQLAGGGGQETAATLRTVRHWGSLGLGLCSP